MVIYDIESEPIIISQSLLNIIFKQKHPEDVLTIYIFYYQTAKYQKTNQVWCTVEFISTGVKISEARVREARKVLLELNLIEDLQKRSEDNTFRKRYVKVNLIWGKEKTGDIVEKQINSRTCDYRSTEMPYYGKAELNTLKVIKRNTLKVIKEIPGYGDEESISPVQETIISVQSREFALAQELQKFLNGKGCRKKDSELPKWEMQIIAFQKTSGHSLRIIRDVLHYHIKGEGFTFTNISDMASFIKFFDRTLLNMNQTIKQSIAHNFAVSNINAFNLPYDEVI